MPAYYRPRVAIVDPGGADVGGLVLIAAAIATAAAVVLFALAHLVLLAVCAVVFIAVMVAVAVAFRRAASPRRWAGYRYPRPTVTITAARPAQAIPAPRPRAITPPAQHLHSHGLSAEDIADVISRQESPAQLPAKEDPWPLA